MAPTPTSGTSTEKKERAMVRADAAVHPRLLSCTLRAIASAASHLTRPTRNSPAVVIACCA